MVRYQYNDHLGSATLETNEQAELISYEEYHPFGTTAYSTYVNSSYSTKRYRFSNKERDDETGLYYFGVRYYAAWLGRWTSSDPADFIDGLNLYRYVRNNPVNLVDADGRSSERVEGDYYNAKGEHLGSDDKKDNKVYSASSVEKNSKGIIISAKNDVLLKDYDGNPISHDDFQKVAATIFGEASTDGDYFDNSRDYKESYGIASAIINRTIMNERSALAVSKRKAYAYGKRNYKKYLSATYKLRNEDVKMNEATAGLINALSSGFDFSYGADSWDGRDLIEKGAIHSRYSRDGDRIGVYIPDHKFAAVTLYTSNVKKYFSTKNITPPSNGVLRVKNFENSRYVVTGSAGQTIFFKASKRADVIKKGNKIYPIIR